MAGSGELELCEWAAREADRLVKPEWGLSAERYFARYVAATLALVRLRDDARDRYRRAGEPPMAEREDAARRAAVRLVEIEIGTASEETL